ncbi:MAG: FAD-binding oxidoreductase [Gammaproteobacteria bacterium]|nr:FAD-binding oxidoreductase [Gammaproteobacteria bacterium]
MPLPPGVAEAQFAQALKEFEGVVGAEWVRASDIDAVSYTDAFQLVPAEELLPAGAIVPASAEQLPEILRIANHYKIPLWPVSRGKNLAYGGSAPRMPGTMVLDLIRLNRIIEVNEDLGYAVVEPGVSFFDLYDHLEQHGIDLWMSLPAPGWGSVMGNALERGVGYTPYGDHASQLCGMQVMLADGTQLRTGMGAMSTSLSTYLFRHGFGPSWDGMFMQSNLGIVTQVGIWLMPAPEASARISIKVPEESQLAEVVDTMRPLRLRNTIDSLATVASPVRQAATTSQRSEYFTGKGAMPRDAVLDMIKTRKSGWWSVSLSVVEAEPVVEARVAAIEKAFNEGVKGAEINIRRWRRGDPIEQSGRPRPGLGAFQMLNWRGGPGGHVDFSPVLPPVGRDARTLYELASSTFFRHGFDYFGGFIFGQRYLINTSVLIYNKDDNEMTTAARACFNELVVEGGKRGFGGYRTHLAFMDQMANQNDYNDHALLRVTEAVKDLLDPNGIIAPGKQGVWPAAYRDRRGT